MYHSYVLKLSKLCTTVFIEIDLSCLKSHKTARKEKKPFLWFETVELLPGFFFKGKNGAQIILFVKKNI